MRKADKVAGGRDRDGAGRFRARVVVVKEPAAVVKEPAALDEDEKPLRPRQCRGYLRRELARSFRGIVDGFVKQAESGSVQHLKLTTELLGEAPEPKRRKGSAVLLMEKLGIESSGGGEEEF